MVNVSQKDVKLQQEINNIIPCNWNNKVGDGQKRYRTLENNSSSNYPKVKTMFYVLFNFDHFMTNLLGYNGSYSLFTGTYDYDKEAKELSKYVIDISKPTISYDLKKMNQYNRIKYVKTNKTYTDITITFMDVKDSVIQKAFFNYLTEIDYDFKNKTFDSFKIYGESKNNYKVNWGLNLNSNKKMFNSITIAEMFINKLMVYTVHNPILKSIKFDNNKMGDFSPQNISVTFSIEGMTNNLLMDNKEIVDIIGKDMDQIGGEDLAHLLQKQWGGSDRISTPMTENYGEKTIKKYEMALNNSIYEKYDVSQDLLKKNQVTQDLYTPVELGTMYQWTTETTPGTLPSTADIVQGTPIVEENIETNTEEKSFMCMNDAFKF